MGRTVAGRVVPKLIWAPQPGPQHALMECPVPVVFFGGARGGGKTDGVLGKWLAKARRYGKAFNALMVRRQRTAAEDAIERAKALWLPMGATYRDNPPRFRMPWGGRVRFGYLDGTQDAQAIQGANLTDIWVEEVGQYAQPGPIDLLQGALRSAEGVPTQLILTGNPGGAGQGWLADRFGLIPFPSRPRLVSYQTPAGAVVRAAVIPSRISDNRILLERDPEYVTRLQAVGSEELVRAWLEGDWSAVEGAFFDGFTPARHVVEPFAVPSDWLRFRSLDWGYAAPFSVGWWAVVGDPVTARTQSGASVTLPRGCLVRYREWYGAASPGVGLRLDPAQVAAGVLQRERAEKVAYGVADPAIFATQGGPSIAETMRLAGLAWRDGDNKRAPGWAQVRARLRGGEDGPMLAAFDTCAAFGRLMPAMQHDPDRAEDLDTESEDHLADEVRYACMSRPWVPVGTPAAVRGRADYRAQAAGEVSPWL